MHILRHQYVAHFEKLEMTKNLCANSANDYALQILEVFF